MPGPKKDTVKVKEPVQDVASTARPTEASAIKPGGSTVEGSATESVPVARNTAAVRMMTSSVSLKKPATGRGKARHTTEVAKLSQKPIAGSGSKGPRRGASKGR
jgi:hypothetical protein